MVVSWEKVVKITTSCGGGMLDRVDITSIVTHNTYYKIMNEVYVGLNVPAEDRQTQKTQEWV